MYINPIDGYNVLKEWQKIGKGDSPPISASIKMFDDILYLLSDGQNTYLTTQFLNQNPTCRLFAT